MILERIPVFAAAGPAQGCEDFRYPRAARGLESGGNLQGVLERRGAEGILDRTHLFGQGDGPGLFATSRGNRFRRSHAGQRCLSGQFAGGLILGAKPANDAVMLFGAALSIERDDGPQDFLAGEVGWPAIRSEVSFAEFVVEFPEDANETGFIDRAILFGQLFVCAKFTVTIVFSFLAIPTLPNSMLRAVVHQRSCLEARERKFQRPRTMAV